MASPFIFEDEVRRIARARWPQATFSGSAMVEGRERDGVFETEDCIHFIEATTRRDAEKARDDTKKLFRAISTQHRLTPYKAAKGWFITRDEPTAEQRAEVHTHGKGQVVACSFSQFQQSIVDAREYLGARADHFFGSVVDPHTGAIKPAVSYIPLDILEMGSAQLFTPRRLADELLSGSRFVLLGDYGAGKSMTLRETFFSLREDYMHGRSTRFPIYLNLREHSGQDDSAEMLERHSRRVGFANATSLVRAWRAGFTVLLIDGFDELTTLGAAGLGLRLRELRRKSLLAVRRLLEQTPDGTGWVIAGREHYFDSPDERSAALGFQANVRTLSLNEFTEAQVGDYLRRATGGVISSLPTWLPTKPLLVGSFAVRGLADILPKLMETADLVDGWDFLIDQICEREAKIAESLDGKTLRRILERLATHARLSDDGLGPISPETIRRAFVAVCEYEPDQQANLLLQRLPGLGVYRVEDATRAFIDADLAEVCRAREIVDFITNPYVKFQDSEWVTIMSGVSTACGATAATRAFRDLNLGPTIDGHVRGANQGLAAHHELRAPVADIFMVCYVGRVSIREPMSVERIFLDNTDFEFDSSSSDFSGVRFASCFFNSIELATDSPPSRLPQFVACAIVRLGGRSSESDLPAGKFVADCEIEQFGASAATISSILGLPLSRGQKIVLSLLRKLFIQSLSGRIEGALVRGLDLPDRAHVPAALRLLEKEGFVIASSRHSDNIWLPNRKMLSRVRHILAAPSATSNEKLLADAKELTTQ